MPDPEDILKKMPKQTPLWAVGLVTIIVGITVSISSFYLLSRSEIQEYLKSSISLKQMAAESDKATQAIKISNESATTSSILNLVTENSKQITVLSDTLNKAQESNFKLTERVAAVEKDLAVSLEKLDKCQVDLKGCNCNKK